MFNKRTVPLLLGVVGLGLLLSGLVRAEGATESSGEGGAASILGTLVLDVSPRTRVTTIGEFDDGVFRLGLWHHEVPITQQVVDSNLDFLVTFNTVPLGSTGVRLDLRLDPKVRAVAVVRSTSDTVELHFSSQTFAGAKVRFMARRGLTQGDSESAATTDTKLAEILAMQLVDPPGWLEWGPITWPTGRQSPLRPVLGLNPEPHPFGRIPREVRRGWNDSPILARSVELANQGRLIEASHAVAGLPLSTDKARALLALARGYIWSQPDQDGEPITPGRAAQAFSLAAALQPEASWAAWARGQAGYNFGRAMKFHNAVYNYEKAIASAPEDPSRSLWEVGAGLALVEAGRAQEGVARLTRNLGGLPSHSDGMRFTGRRAVAHVLWSGGEVSRAAKVFDLLLVESPSLAANPRHDERWGRLLLDADRPAEAYTYFERLEKNSLIQVERERARWWLHEAGLAQKDGVRARRWLREIIQRTPASTLGPLGKVRLRILDAIESGGERTPGLRYQEVVLALRNQALEWADTPVQDEALSFAGQLFFELDMLEDGLHLYRWVEARTPSEGGAIAYSKVICERAPSAFDDLRARGHTLRAVGVFRVFLDTPAGRTCVDSEMRASAAATAETAGLPTLATRWLGQAVATGGTTANDALNLIELARLYLREGNLKSAQKTLRYIEATSTLVPDGLVDEVWGDIQLQMKNFKEAAASYEKALKGVAKSARHRNRDSRIRSQHGLALRALGQHDEAIVDLGKGIDAGGAPRGAQGWIALLESTLAVASKAADYEKALELCLKAEQVELNETSHRAVNWHRSHALTMLGRTEEADQILQDLSGGTDAWAIMAVEAQLDSRFNKEIERLLSLPTPTLLEAGPSAPPSVN